MAAQNFATMKLYFPFAFGEANIKMRNISSIRSASIFVELTIDRKFGYQIPFSKTFCDLNFQQKHSNRSYYISLLKYASRRPPNDLETQETTSGAFFFNMFSLGSLV